MAKGFGTLIYRKKSIYKSKIVSIKCNQQDIFTYDDMNKTQLSNRIGIGIVCIIVIAVIALLNCCDISIGLDHSNLSSRISVECPCDLGATLYATITKSSASAGLLAL